MKKKLFSLIIAFTFILTGAMCLTACGGDKTPKKQATSIEARLTNSADDFISAGQKTYDEDFSLSASDFTVVVNYNDGKM